MRAKSKLQYPCTECGGDATVALSAGKNPGQDWGGKIHQGERLCFPCAKKRGVVLFRDQIAKYPGVTLHTA